MDIGHNKSPEIADKMIKHRTLTPGQRKSNATLLRRHRNQILEVSID